MNAKIILLCNGVLTSLVFVTFATSIIEIMDAPWDFHSAKSSNNPSSNKGCLRDKPDPISRLDANFGSENKPVERTDARKNKESTQFGPLLNFHDLTNHLQSYIDDPRISSSSLPTEFYGIRESPRNSRSTAKFDEINLLYYLPPSRHMDDNKLPPEITELPNEVLPPPRAKLENQPARTPERTRNPPGTVPDNQPTWTPERTRNSPGTESDNQPARTPERTRNPSRLEPDNRPAWTPERTRNPSRLEPGNQPTWTPERTRNPSRLEPDNRPAWTPERTRNPSRLEPDNRPAWTPERTRNPSRLEPDNRPAWTPERTRNPSRLEPDNRPAWTPERTRNPTETSESSDDSKKENKQENQPEIFKILEKKITTKTISVYPFKKRIRKPENKNGDDVHNHSRQEGHGPIESHKEPSHRPVGSQPHTKTHNTIKNSQHTTRPDYSRPCTETQNSKNKELSDHPEHTSIRQEKHESIENNKRRKTCEDIRCHQNQVCVSHFTRDALCVSIKRHHGECPNFESKRLKTKRGNCTDDCQYDMECYSDEKCCYDGCKYSCTKIKENPVHSFENLCLQGNRENSIIFPYQNRSIPEDTPDSVCFENCQYDTQCSKGLRCCSGCCRDRCSANDSPRNCSLIQCPSSHNCIHTTVGSQCVNVTAKEGHCPEQSENLGLYRSCKTTCQYDNQCGGEQKCCNNGCAMTCTNPKSNDCSTTNCLKGFKCRLNSKGSPKCFPIPCKQDGQVVDIECNSCTCIQGFLLCSQEECPPTKSGFCPRLVRGYRGKCTIDCKSDYDCEKEQKCCSTGCGYTCKDSIPEIIHPCRTVRFRCGADTRCAATRGLCKPGKPCPLVPLCVSRKVPFCESCPPGKVCVLQKQSCLTGHCHRQPICVQLYSDDTPFHENEDVEQAVIARQQQQIDRSRLQ